MLDKAKYIYDMQVKVYMWVFLSVSVNNVKTSHFLDIIFFFLHSSTDWKEYQPCVLLFSLQILDANGIVVPGEIIRSHDLFVNKHSPKSIRDQTKPGEMWET